MNMNVACCVLWGGSRSTKPCVFPCKVAASKLRGIDLSADFLHFGARDFPFKSPCKKVLENCLFCALASRSGFGAAMSDAVARSSIVSFADRIGTAA